MADKTTAGLLPDRNDAVDLGFVLVAMVLAVLGFSSTFAGGEEFLVGIPAVLLGTAVGWATVRLRQPWIVSVAGAVLVFVLFAGAIAIRSEAIAGVLPSPGVFLGLANGLISGWKRLLTTLPPAGEAGDLLAIPYVVGFVGSIVATVLTFRPSTRRWHTVPPVVVLVVAVLFGTNRPASLLLQGAVLGAVLLAWLAVRDQRGRQVSSALPQRSQLVTGGLLVLLVFGLALPVGAVLPGAANDRFILRDHVLPPFDPLSHPSPLAGYRRYVGPDNEQEPVLEVRGLPPGASIRIASLETYDGLVWRATGRGSASSGTFARIGPEVPDPPEGERSTVEITVLRPHGVWLPTVGDVAGVRFSESDLADQLRFNVATNTAAVPTGTRSGMTYEVEAVVTAIDADLRLDQLPLDRRFAPPDTGFPTDLVAIAAELRGPAESPYGRMSAIAEALRTDGAFSDGGSEVWSPSGHSLARLTRFLGAPQWVGNGEQYAAALALLGHAEGIPARVVMGFQPTSNDANIIVTGADISAWVEIPLEGAGWVPIQATPPKENLPDPSIKPRPRELSPDPQPPPPPVLPPPAKLPTDLDANEAEPEEEEEEEPAAERSVMVLVLMAVAGASVLALTPMAVVVLLKLARSRRRRSLSDPVARAHGGWSEALDWARDFGQPVVARSTRREASLAMAVPSAAALADRVDVATFGASAPTDEEVTALWEQTQQVLTEMRANRSIIDRLRAAASVTSLRSSTAG